MGRKLRIYLRLIVFFINLAVLSSPCIILYLITGKVGKLNQRIRILWAKISLMILGVNNKIVGEWPNPLTSTLIVCNHRTFVDPLVTLAYVSANPLAKASVGKMPLLGIAAKATGLLLVNRKSPESRAASKTAMQSALLKGENILLYPEGTTSNERIHLPFKKGGFQICAENKLNLLPIYIVYDDQKDHWVDLSLKEQFDYTFGKRRTRTQIFVGQSFNSDNVEQLIEHVHRFFTESAQ